MNRPIPLVVQTSGEAVEAPDGAVPVALYGEAHDGDQITSADGSVVAQAEDSGTFKVIANTGDSQGILRVLQVGGVYSVLATDEDSNPLDSSWSPAGLVTHQDLDMRAPEPPASGTYVLRSTNGVLSWGAP